MLYFLDTEFLDTGSTIELVSIGIVSSDGREFYRQCVEFDPKKANAWVKENVFPHLLICKYTLQGPIDSIPRTLKQHKHGQCLPRMNEPERWRCPWRTREHIREEVRRFINADEGKPEFIGWCSSYDHVALCQLFGTMMDMPLGWPHYIKDFQQVLDDRGISDNELPQQEGTTHNALDDARHLAKLWGHIVRNDAWQ